MAKTFSWSWSRFDCWRNCPAQYNYRYIRKMPEPPAEAMERGKQIHTLAEQYLEGKLRVLPKELKLFEAEFKRLRELAKKRTVTSVIEGSWAFARDWSLTKWDDWASCWLRVKVDHAVSLDGKDMLITDWKTGKFRIQDVPKYLAQLSLYGLAAFMVHPNLEHVKTRLAYLDGGFVFPDPVRDKAYVDMTEFTRDGTASLRHKWELAVKPFQNDTLFKPRPSALCRFCNYSRSKGGPCRF